MKRKRAFGTNQSTRRSEEETAKRIEDGKSTSPKRPVLEPNVQFVSCDGCMIGNVPSLYICGFFYRCTACCFDVCETCRANGVHVGIDGHFLYPMGRAPVPTVVTVPEESLGALNRTEPIKMLERDKVEGVHHEKNPLFTPQDGPCMSERIISRLQRCKLVPVGKAQNGKELSSSLESYLVSKVYEGNDYTAIPVWKSSKTIYKMWVRPAVKGVIPVLLAGKDYTHSPSQNMLLLYFIHLTENEIHFAYAIPVGLEEVEHIAWGPDEYFRTLQNDCVSSIVAVAFKKRIYVVPLLKEANVSTSSERIREFHLTALCDIELADTQKVEKVVWCHQSTDGIIAMISRRTITFVRIEINTLQTVYHVDLPEALSEVGTEMLIAYDGHYRIALSRIHSDQIFVWDMQQLFWALRVRTDMRHQLLDWSLFGEAPLLICTSAHKVALISRVGAVTTICDVHDCFLNKTEYFNKMRASPATLIGTSLGEGIYPIASCSSENANEIHELEGTLSSAYITMCYSKGFVMRFKLRSDIPNECELDAIPEIITLKAIPSVSNQNMTPNIHESSESSALQAPRFAHLLTPSHLIYIDEPNAQIVLKKI